MRVVRTFALTVAMILPGALSALELNTPAGSISVGGGASGGVGVSVDTPVGRTNVGIGADINVRGPLERQPPAPGQSEGPGHTGPIHESISRLGRDDLMSLRFKCRQLLNDERRHPGANDPLDVRICRIVEADFNPL